MKMKQDIAGYKEINTPEVLDRSMWEKSGHWENLEQICILQLHLMKKYLRLNQ